MRIWLGLALLFLIVPGCSHRYHSRTHSSQTVVMPAKRHGPPPHAPAHGYRHKHADGMQLRYDSGMQIYLVVDHDGYYYDDGFYFRYRSGSWEMAASFSGEWKIAAEKRLPKALRKHKNKKHRK